MTGWFVAQESVEYVADHPGELSDAEDDHAEEGTPGSLAAPARQGGPGPLPA